jgi:hypothetical protein
LPGTAYNIFKPPTPSPPLLRSHTTIIHLYTDQGQAEAPLLGGYSESSSLLPMSAYDDLQKYLK